MQNFGLKHLHECFPLSSNVQPALAAVILFIFCSPNTQMCPPDSLPALPTGLTTKYPEKPGYSQFQKSRAAMELSLRAQPSFQSIDVTTLCVKKYDKNINISTIIIHHRSKIFLRQSQWVLLGPSVIIKIYFIRRSTGLLVNCPAFGNSFIQLCFLSLSFFRSLSVDQEHLHGC